MGQFKAGARARASSSPSARRRLQHRGARRCSPQATTELFDGLVAKVGRHRRHRLRRHRPASSLATLVLYLVSAACSLRAGLDHERASRSSTCYRLRRAIAEKIDRDARRAISSAPPPATRSRASPTTWTRSGQSLNQGVTQLITSATTIVGVLVMMLTINPRS